ncbi:carboxypeptidase regulatory-like domain-containing protein, partial [Arthrobacter sp. MDT1-48-3]
LGTGRLYTLSILNANGASLYNFDLTGADSDGIRLAAQQINLPVGRSYIKVYGERLQASWGKTYTLNTAMLWSATPVPTISGTPQVGRTLTAAAGAWAPTPTALRFQWFRSGTAITGATKNTYALVAADLDKTITVKVTGSRTGYRTTTKASVATAPVKAGTLTAGTPVITGTTTVGSILTANPGVWGPSPVTLEYTWYRSGALIPGATATSYKLTTADAGKTITVSVTGKKTAYNTAVKTSAATSLIKTG